MKIQDFPAPKKGPGFDPDINHIVVGSENRVVGLYRESTGEWTLWPGRFKRRRDYLDTERRMNERTTNSVDSGS